MSTRDPIAANLNNSPRAVEIELVGDRFILIPVIITSQWTLNIKMRI